MQIGGELVPRERDLGPTALFANRELQTEFAWKSRRRPKVRTAEEVTYEVPKYQSPSLGGGEVNRFRKQRPR